jgi:hypothetical protein
VKLNTVDANRVSHELRPSTGGDQVAVLTNTRSSRGGKTEQHNSCKLTTEGAWSAGNGKELKYGGKPCRKA